MPLKSKVRKWAEQMAQDWLEAPADTLGAKSRLVVLAMNQAVIENFLELAAFSPEQVRILVRDGAISIVGQNLCIRSVTPEELLVEGEISQVRFSRDTESGWA